MTPSVEPRKASISPVAIGAHGGVSLGTLPPTRRSIVEALKKRGEMSTAELASLLTLTVPAVRRHLSELAAQGMVSHDEGRGRPGRPSHVYRLSPAAEVLFPKRYSDLANELLSYLDEAGPGLVPRAFSRRQERRTEMARARLRGLSFDDKVAELAKILDEDGYLAEAHKVEDGFWTVTEHNCAILEVAARYGQACVSEIGFLRDTLPEATIERVSHMMAGAHVCSYEIRRREEP